MSRRTHKHTSKNASVIDRAEPDRDALFEAICQRIDSQSLAQLGSYSGIAESHGVRFELSLLCRAGKVPLALSSPAIEACITELMQPESCFPPDAESKSSATRRLFASTILLSLGGEAGNCESLYFDVESDVISGAVSAVLCLDLPRFGPLSRSLLTWRTYAASRRSREAPLFIVADAVIRNRSLSGSMSWRDCVSADGWQLIAETLSESDCVAGSGVNLGGDEWLDALIERGRDLGKQRWHRLIGERRVRNG